MHISQWFHTRAYGRSSLFESPPSPSYSACKNLFTLKDNGFTGTAAAQESDGVIYLADYKNGGKALMDCFHTATLKLRSLLTLIYFFKALSLFCSQLASQELTDFRFREHIAEFDILRDFVRG
jgi:hypothetical protein